MWAEEDRPREKLLQKGHRALTDAELLAILIGSGTQNQTAVEVARKVLSLSKHNLVQLGRISIEELMSIKGIGEAKAVSVLAAMELGRRRQQAEFIKETPIRNSRQAYKLLAPILSDLDHEEFWIVLLNRKSVLIKYKCMTRGGFSGTIIDIKQVFHYAVEEKASFIILAHNHPAGTLSPSKQDIEITAKLVEAGGLLDISIADHLIITNNGFYSFSDEGEL